jgi:iron only hydrogenase large subunit-like protein
MAGGREGGREKSSSALQTDPCTPVALTHPRSLGSLQVMACPSGCLNGGGQLKPGQQETPAQLLERLEQAYFLEVRASRENAPILRG